MNFAQARAVTLTSIIVLSMAIAGIGTIPARSTGATSDEVHVTGTLEAHNGEAIIERKLSIKNEGIFVHQLTTSTGGFNFSVPANDTYNIVFEQFNSTAGEDFPRDGRPDLHAVGTIQTDTSDVSLGTETLPQGHVLNVTVVNGSGDPVPGATIYLAHHNNGARATNDAHTNENGMLVLNGSEVEQVGVELNGTVEVFVNGPAGYGDTHTELTVGTQKNIELTLQQTAKVNGTVSDSSSDPVVGDSVIIESDTEWKRDTTGSQGNFSVDVPTGDTYQFHYYQDEVDQPAPNDDIPDLYTFGTDTIETDTTYNKQLPAGHNLTIDVVDANGNTVENASVHVHQHHHGDTIGTSLEAGSDGTARIDIANGSTGIHVEPPAGSNLSENGTHFTLAGDTTKTIVLHPTVSVTGNVTTQNGVPISDWFVVGNPTEDDGQHNSAKLAGDGSFALPLSQNASYMLGFHQEDYENDTFYPKDGVPDLAILQGVQTGTEDVDVGTHPLPVGHQFNITVLKPDGSMASNLQGHVAVVDESNDLRKGSSAHTDENGVLRLDRAATEGIEVNGTIHVDIDAPDGATYADAHREYTVTSDGNTTIQLKPALEVNGTVFEPDGDSAAEERINVHGPDDGDTVFTDSNGAFSTSVVKGGEYDVGFVQVAGVDQYEPTFPQDGVPDVYALESVTDKSEAALGSQTLPAPHNLTVHVVDENGNALSDAEVNLHSDANNAHAWARGYTDENGTFSAEVVGPLGVHVEPPTEALTDNGTHLTVDSDTELTVTLHNTTTINGTVYDSTGAGAENVRIHFHTDRQGRSAVTESTGHYSVSVVESDSYHVDLTQEGLSGESFPDDGIPGAYATGELTDNTTPQDFTLPQGHDLEIRVVDESGNNVTDARVDVGHLNNEFIANVDGDTNTNGMFVPDGASDTGIEMNGSVRVHVRPPEGTSYLENSTNIQVTSDRTVRIVLRDGVPVTGSLEYADGTPASGWHAEAFHQGGDGDRTNDDGNFTLIVRPDNEYDLAYKQTDWDGGKSDYPKDGWADLYAFKPITVGSSGQDVGTQVIPRGHLLNVTVVNTSGMPVEDIEVDVAPINGDASAHHFGDTNADGEVVLDGAATPGIEANGTVRIHVDATGQYAETQQTYTVNRSRDVTVVLPEAVTVSGQVVDSNSSALAGDLFGARNEADFGRIQETTQDGAFSFSVPENDTYNFVYYQRNDTDDSWFPQDGVTDLYEAAILEVGDQNVSTGAMTIPNADGVLDVRVLAENGTPVKDARVSIIPNQQGEFRGWYWLELTDSDGYPTADHATRGYEAAGNYTIIVQPPESSTEFEDTEYVRNVTVTNDTIETFTLETNTTVTPSIEGVVTLPDGSPVAQGSTIIVNGNNSWDLPKTESNGKFTQDLTENGTYGVSVSQRGPGGNMTPRDGVVDTHLLGIFNVSGPTNISTHQLPAGHVIDVKVVSSTGSPVENASVTYWNSQTNETYRSGWLIGTNAVGYAANDRNLTGLEVRGDISIRVTPPENSTRFADQKVVKNLTVTQNDTLTVELTEKKSDITVDYSVESTTVKDGTPVNVTATATNVGTANGTKDVTLTIKEGGTSVTTVTKEVTLAPGETTTVEFSETVASGSYDVTINDLSPTIVTVTAPVDVSVRLPDSQVGVGQNTTVEIVASNVTDGVGSFDINVSSENTTVASITDASVAIDANEDVNIVDDGSEARLIASFGKNTQTGEVVIATVTVNASSSGQTPIQADVTSIGSEAGDSYYVDSTTNSSLTVVPVPAVGNKSHRPTDLDSDGKFEDVNGDGVFKLSDVQTLFKNTDGEIVNQYPDAFDFNDNGEFDIVDVQALYNLYLEEGA